MILTLAEAKALLLITDDTLDATLSIYLPIIESDIYICTKNDFMVKEYTSSSVESGVIYADNDLSPDDTIMFESGINGQVPLTVLTATSTEITVTDDLDDEFSENSFVRMKYPKGLKIIASQMVRYKLDQNPGVKSESIGQYSVTYEEASSGYPIQLWEALRKGYSKYFKRSE
jgi:hypothetical protein